MFFVIISTNSNFNLECTIYSAKKVIEEDTKIFKNIRLEHFKIYHSFEELFGDFNNKQLLIDLRNGQLLVDLDSRLIRNLETILKTKYKYFNGAYYTYLFENEIYKKTFKESFILDYSLGVNNITFGNKLLEKKVGSKYINSKGYLKQLHKSIFIGYNYLINYKELLMPIRYTKPSGVIF